MPIRYAQEPDLSPQAFVDLLARAGLAERRPVREPARIAAMLRHADLILCARDDQDRLVGVSRAVTDFAYCCYLSDLAVDRRYQGQGIGTALIRHTHGAARRSACCCFRPRQRRLTTRKSVWRGCRTASDGCVQAPIDHSSRGCAAFALEKPESDFQD